jgi:hypothetical protein
LTEFRERRARPRVEEPFPVTVRGVDVTGERLDMDTVLDNVSEGGLYVRIPRRLELGSRVTVGIRFYDPETQSPGARVAARGVVLRVESIPFGEHGLGVGFAKYRVF